MLMTDSTISQHSKHDTPNKKSTNVERIERRIAVLASLGWDVETIQTKYNDGMSKNDIIAAINQKAGKTVISKSSLASLWTYAGLKNRSIEETNVLRMAKINESQRRKYATDAKYGVGITADEAVIEYQTGKSLESMYREYGISPSVLSRILQERNIKVRKQTTLENRIQELAAHGFTQKRLHELYNDDNLTATELLQLIKTETGHSIGERTWSKIVNKLGLKKSADNMAKNRGRSSRKAKETSLARLLKTPYKDLDSLAVYFHANRTLTYHDLVDELNNCLDDSDPKFTIRWLERWMTPLLPTNRDKGTSRLEQSVGAFVRSVYSGPVEERVRSLIGPYEVDFFFPELRFAIEVNGLYWHSEQFGKNRNYHRDKYVSCRAQGVSLFQVWEDDWYYKRSILQRMIAHRLKVSPKGVGARQARIGDVSVSVAREFMNTNHIQGFVGASKHFGLWDKKTNLLVAVFSVVKQQDCYFIVRYATSVSVPGGFSKLLKHFEIVGNPRRVVTFSDCEISDGFLYEQNGFRFDQFIRPDYKYVVNGKREHKFGFRKIRFERDPDLLFDSSATENELAKLNGLGKVWDSGKVRWVKTFD